MSQLMKPVVNSELHRQKLVKASHMHFVHWIIVAVSVLLTFSAWQYSKVQLNEKLETKFERYAEQTINLVIERMKLYENALWSGVAHIDASNKTLKNSDWITYANSLNISKTYPGINGIGVIYNLKPEQADSFLHFHRALRPSFSIHPQHNQAELWPITFIEPYESNKNAVGLDVAFEANRYAAINKSRDTGKAQITAPIILVQDAKKTPGFLFYTPFYSNGQKPETINKRKQHILGVTYAPFIMENLMRGTLDEDNRQVSIVIKDENNILYNDHGDHLNDNTHFHKAGYDHNPLFVKQKNIAMYGRTWSFHLQSNFSFKSEYEANESSFILIGGLLIDALLLGLFLFLSKANRDALKYADSITEQLELKTKYLEKSNSDLEQFSYIASHDLKSPLNAIKQLVGWIKEDCEAYIPEDSKKHLNMLSQRSDRMMKLLNDLLDYSQVNRTSFEKEPVNLQVMCVDLEKLLDLPEGFTIFAPDVSINVQRVPFEIVLRNLLSNAIKHHDKDNANIYITVNATDELDILTVEDDGPGIPKQYHEKVMEMFQTLKPRDKVEASGMGLAMIKKIMTHYKGKVSIESNGIRGTKVSVSWPR